MLAFTASSFAEGKTVYLSAGPWADDGGHFAVWAWEGENEGQWIPMEYVDNEFAVYKAELPQGTTNFLFARFYTATAVGSYAWEKGETDNRPSHVTADIDVKDGVDLYRITAMGPMYRTTGNKSGMFEESGTFTPAQWEWKDYTVTFETNKGWENVYAFVWNNNNGANFDDRVITLENGKISKPKGNGTKITATLENGVYTYSFKAEDAPLMIRFSNGKSGTAKEQTDNMEFVNGKLYTFNNPGKTVYLSAGPWADDGGHFAVWAWEGENEGQWIPMEYVDNEFAVYKAELPQGTTNFLFARFYTATAVGSYAWEKGETDNRPSHVTADIDVKDGVDLYRITAMGPMYRTTGNKSGMFEESGTFTPAQWEWKDYTVTFETNKGWENVYAFVWNNNNGANFDDRVITLENGKISKPKGNGTKITATLENGVYTYSFKAEDAPLMIRFSNGKSGTAKEQTDNMEFVNGKLYKFNNPVYYLVGTMNDWTISDEYQLEPNPETEGEYMITLDLAAGTELKVKSNDDIWYPGDGSDNYKLENGGNYTVYFRPDGSGGDDWYYKYLFVKDSSTGINAINAALKKGAVIYTLQGVRVNQVVKGNIYIINGKKVLVK